MRKHNKITSIKDLMSDIDQDLYTYQTIQSLSRSFLETIIENRSNAVILVRVKEAQNVQTLLERLKYTDSKIYSYSENIDGFNSIKLDYPEMENDEFFVIVAERFSACLYWKGSELNEGFCSLNPGETKRMIEYLQSVAYSKDLESDLSDILQDRRNNEKFTIILRKIVSNLENRQRDLICANSELKENTGESQKLASLSQLFSTAMHEIRNPLGAIDLHSKIVQKKLERVKTEDEQTLKEVQETLVLIRKTTENLGQTLTELLDFSKPLTLEKSEINLAQTVEEIVTLIKPSYEDKNVGLHFENSLQTDFLTGFDRAKFHQVIFNILKNALEATSDEGEVKVSLTDGYDNIYLKISDNGIGISEENREKIFKPYFTTKKEGTGLGLAEARKIVEAHEGALFVEPGTLKGTTFVLTLPGLYR